MGPAATPALQEAAPPRAPALRVAVATRGGLIAEPVAALLREHGLDATLPQAQGTARPAGPPPPRVAGPRPRGGAARPAGRGAARSGRAAGGAGVRGAPRRRRRCARRP